VESGPAHVREVADGLKTRVQEPEVGLPGVAVCGRTQVLQQESPDRVLGNRLLQGGIGVRARFDLVEIETCQAREQMVEDAEGAAGVRADVDDDEAVDELGTAQARTMAILPPMECPTRCTGC